uniref:Family with sequence similarity 107 member B n=1 Tax=Anser cygnoides TaxID=8845 RepID=A0A8B9EVF4_ANSCY
MPGRGATPFYPLTLSGFPPRLPLAPREPDNKGGSVLGAGGAAWALTQRRVRPRPAPGPAAPLRRGRAGSERAAAAFPPALCPSSFPPGVPLSSCRCLSPAAPGEQPPPRSTKKTSLQPAVCIQGTHRIDRSKIQHAPLVKDTVSKDTEPKDPYPTPRKIMAEPDYIDDDNPELIRPQKLINPVKSSRNHQDLHRELLMNQKRGLAPQNKPELQKVMEKRKRDQVIKQQKEEEAQKKKSDLEIELLKRQQKLEQLELEQQKIQEEQENAPEFVKVKGNLRRTVQEATEAPDS